MAVVRNFNRFVGGALLAALFAGGAVAGERYKTLPPTPPPVAGAVSGYAAVNGVRLYYASIGQGRPVVLLHGGLANSDYWGNQVRALMAGHRVILVDSRGHGRSTRSAAPFGYDLMTDDVVALLTQLHIARADIVGWSDGGILALDMAMRHPDRVRRVVAFAANTRPDGNMPEDFLKAQPVWAAYVTRAAAEYKKLSPTPGAFEAFVAQIEHMWASEPSWSDAQLRRITAPVLIMDGDHDEAIKLSHTEYIAATVPGARLVILPDTSHFAFLQDPAGFNAMVLKFLDAA